MIVFLGIVEECLKFILEDGLDLRSGENVLLKLVCEDIV